MRTIFTTLFIFIAFNCSAQTAANNSFFVRTTDSLPFLKYGLGEDRLGGAKMTFLDSNVLLIVVDSSFENYKVQLSTLHAAYIEKSKVYKIAEEKIQSHLTDSWSVYGDSLFDYVTVKLDEKLPYKSEMEIHPTRIILTIYGAVSNTNWITQLTTAKEIKNVWYEQPEDDVIRVIIELRHNQNWGYRINYGLNNRLTVRVKRQPAILDIKHIKIAIDAGHGGENIGATGINTNIQEKDYTLLFAQEVVRQLLQKKNNVVMTRVKDTTLSMYERIKFLNEQQPDLLISIHLNSSSNITVSGVSTYYRYIGFRPLSQAILKSMLTLGLNEYGNVGGFNFSLNGPTDYPNCLVEVAFLSNEMDEKKIMDPKFRKAVATKIIAGIQNFLQKK